VVTLGAIGFVVLGPAFAAHGQEPRCAPSSVSCRQVSRAARADALSAAPMWEDDMESATTLIGLFPTDGSRFTELQTEAGGVCSLETAVVHSGSNSVKCLAPATGSAKADLGRQDVSGEISGQIAPPRFG